MMKVDWSNVIQMTVQREQASSRFITIVMMIQRLDYEAVPYFEQLTSIL